MERTIFLANEKNGCSMSGVLDINIVVVYLLHYIGIKHTTVDICSTIVPSVACQTTEGKYHSY